MSQAELHIPMAESTPNVPPEVESAPAAIAGTHELPEDRLTERSSVIASPEAAGNFATLTNESGIRPV